MDREKPSSQLNRNESPGQQQLTGEAPVASFTFTEEGDEREKDGVEKTEVLLAPGGDDDQEEEEEEEKMMDKRTPLLVNGMVVDMGHGGREQRDSVLSFEGKKEGSVGAEQPDQQAVELVWCNLTYSINIHHWNLDTRFPYMKYKKEKKVILKNQSGFIRTGCLTAIFGPSGAGKSTLLECLTGRRRSNLKGDVYITCPECDNGCSSSRNSINKANEQTVAFIGQKDTLIEVLTVRENLLFASKLKNYKEERELIERKRKLSASAPTILSDVSDYHEAVVQNVIAELSLESCMNTLVRLCSGEFR